VIGAASYVRLHDCTGGIPEAVALYNRRETAWDRSRYFSADVIRLAAAFTRSAPFGPTFQQNEEAILN